MAFSIKQLIPVPIKRAVKKLLGMEKPKPVRTTGSPSGAKTASKPSSAGSASHAKPASGTPGTKKKGGGKRPAASRPAAVPGRKP